MTLSTFKRMQQKPQEIKIWSILHFSFYSYIWQERNKKNVQWPPEHTTRGKTSSPDAETWNAAESFRVSLDHAWQRAKRQRMAVCN